jgi:hypothetical protein
LDPIYGKLAAEYARLAEGYFGDRLVSICFFGSVARGDATPESDVDVLVVAENLPRDIGFRARQTQFIRDKIRGSEAHRKLRLEGRNAFISEILLSPEEVKTHPPILLDITDDGLIMYDRNSFLESVLADIRLRLKDLGGRKVKARRGHYWILKPDADPNEVVEL